MKKLLNELMADWDDKVIWLSAMFLSGVLVGAGLQAMKVLGQ